jgi:tRNA-2-methylthio-N6-dimethylallyladenosine synthase
MELDERPRADESAAPSAAADGGALPKKVHVETWGCQMNTADSERMLSLLQGRGYELTHGGAEDADLILLNTCHIREKARHKVLSRLGVLKELKDGRPGVRIAVAGCVAQADGRRLLDAAPQIDVLFGPGKIDELPRLLEEREETGESAVATGFGKGKKGKKGVDVDVDGDGDVHVNVHLHERERERGHGESDEGVVAPPTLTGKREVSRFVTIQNGCNNYCTFCVVPFTRGRETSRGPGEVLAEAAALVRGGARELTFLGQNVNSYGHDLLEAGTVERTGDGPFVEVLRAAGKIEGLERIRFTSSNPHDFTPALARLFAEEPKMGRYIHLPVQAGSDETLARMQRKVTVEEYRQRLAWLRQAVPDIAVSTDLIVGFPGETEEQFLGTLALVEEARFTFSFAFKYSPRRNTPAARWGDQVPEAVKEDRLARLNALQDRITTEGNLAEVGQVRPVLFHYESSKNPGYYYGRTEHFRLVRVPSARPLTGEVARVRITHGNKTALLGELV